MRRVLNREDAVLVVVDVQERLVPAIDKELYARSLRNFKIAIEAAGTLGLPILLTEQYPKGLGRTVPTSSRRSMEDIQADREGLLQLRPRRGVPRGPCEDCPPAGDPDRHGNPRLRLPDLVDLVNAGYEVFVLDDAVSSRFVHNYRSGIAALRDAGPSSSAPKRPSSR